MSVEELEIGPWVIEDIPLATIPISALLTGELITPIMLLAAAVILAGVYFGALAAEPRSATA